jgi:hypothetical protein
MLDMRWVGVMFCACRHAVHSAAKARRLLSEQTSSCFNTMDDVERFPHLAVQLAVAEGIPVVAPSWLLACGEAGGMVSACTNAYSAAVAASSVAQCIARSFAWSATVPRLLHACSRLAA